jgi:hypothetical protein
MKAGAMKALLPALTALSLATGMAVVSGQEQAAPEAPAKPAPRWPDGRISFTGTPTEVGNWEGPANGTIFFNIVNGKKVTPPSSLATNLTVDQVPFQPWARDAYMKRESQAEDPHTRCKPSGGARRWHTPYGIEILDLPETHEVLVLSVGSPHSWQQIPTARAEHLKDPKPSWYGDAIGHWEGDTLVVDTVGFNERFWLTREGVPHTSKLHLTERISRPTFNQLRYEATVDDPGAYTKTWSGGWNLRWSEGNEPFDYLCQENNRDPQRMVGPQAGAAQ